MGSFLSCQENPRDPSKQLEYCHCFLCLPGKEDKVPVVNDIKHLGHRIWKNRSKSDLEATSLRARSQNYLLEP